MNLITSKDNNIYKLVKQLAAKKHRDKWGLYLIEGENLLKEAVINAAEIEFLIARSDYDREKLFDFMKPGHGPGIKTYFLEQKLFDHLAQTEHSQGILAAVKMPPQGELLPGANYVVLDRLQDPGNIGAIIRTADAAGYGGAVIIKGTADVFAPKVVRAAAGSIFRLPLIMVDSASRCAELLKRANKKMVATVMNTEHFYYDENLSANVAILIGNEGNGLDPELIEASDVKIKIPMNGKIDSLNASIAAGILMYEAMRR